MSKYDPESIALNHAIKFLAEHGIALVPRLENVRSELNVENITDGDEDIDYFIDESYDVWVQVRVPAPADRVITVNIDFDVILYAQAYNEYDRYSGEHYMGTPEYTDSESHLKNVWIDNENRQTGKVETLEDREKCLRYLRMVCAKH